MVETFKATERVVPIKGGSRQFGVCCFGGVSSYTNDADQVLFAHISKAFPMKTLIENHL